MSESMNDFVQTPVWAYRYIVHRTEKFSVWIIFGNKWNVLVLTGRPPDSLRVAILAVFAGLARAYGDCSNELAGVVVSAFRLTPFFDLAICCGGSTGSIPPGALFI